jgi:hypothetical protein
VRAVVVRAVVVRAAVGTAAWALKCPRPPPQAGSTQVPEL